MVGNTFIKLRFDVLIKVIKMATKKSTSWNSVLQFLGSLVFLWVLYGWWTAGWSVPAWFGGAGAFWVPIFGGVAIFSVISLFIMSLVNLLMGMPYTEHSMKITQAAAVTLFAFTVGGGLFVATIVAFILCYWGIGGQMK